MNRKSRSTFTFKLRLLTATCTAGIERIAYSYIQTLLGHIQNLEHKSKGNFTREDIATFFFFHIRLLSMSRGPGSSLHVFRFVSSSPGNNAHYNSSRTSGLTLLTSFPKRSIPWSKHVKSRNHTNSGMYFCMSQMKSRKSGRRHNSRLCNLLAVWFETNYLTSCDIFTGKIKLSFFGSRHLARQLTSLSK